MDRLEKLNVNFNDLAINMVLNSLPSWCDRFIVTNHLNNTKTKLVQLHNILQTTEVRMKKSHPTSVSIAPILASHQHKGKKRKVVAQPKWKGKAHIGASNGG